MSSHQNENPSTSRHHEGDSDHVEAVIYYVGKFGRYQKILFVVMLPFAVSFAFVYISQVFCLITPKNYWCYVPILKAIQNATVRRHLISPFTPEHGWDECHMFKVNYNVLLLTQVPPDPMTTETIPCDDGWEFEINNADLPYQTVVSERGWVCDKAYYVPLIHSMFFLGASVGGIVSGIMADKHGRVPALVGLNIVGFVGGIASIFTSGMWDYALCRFVAGMSFDNCFIMMYILVMEYVGRRHRTIVANMAMAIYFGGACVLIPWLAYYISDWRTFTIVTALPMLAAAVPAMVVVPESVRWLYCRGYMDRAVKVLKKFERINKVKIPNNVMENFKNSGQKVKIDETLVTVFASPLMNKGLIYMFLTYGAAAVVYDCLTRVGEDLGMNLFLTFTLTMLVEIPANATIALLLDSCGRRLFTCEAMFLAGVLSIIGIFMPQGGPLVAMCMLARFAIILGFNAATQWTVEIMPTPCRASGSSLIHIGGYIASIVSINLVHVGSWSGIPLVLATIFSIFGAIFSCFLPETTGLPLPQTTLEGEHVMLNYNIAWDELIHPPPEEEEDEDEKGEGPDKGKKDDNEENKTESTNDKEKP